MDADKYRNVMRHQAGAVTIIAVGAAGNRTGLTATAVCSLTDSPPMVIACVNRSASAHAPIQSGQCFSINLLASDQNELARRFSSKKLEGEARFDADTWDTLATGAPVHREDALDLHVEILAGEGRHLTGLRHKVEHLQHVQAVVVGEEQLGAVVGTR